MRFHFLTGIAFLILVTITSATEAQDTLSKATPDTERVKREGFHIYPEEHSPKAAAISSAILPGLGQAYNKKYWKIPIVYAGLATAGYFIYYNYTIYNNFRTAYILQTDGDSTTNLSSFDVWYITGKQTINLSGYESSALQTVQNQYRNYTDLSVIIAAGIYALNILDAVVDAHFYNFDVSDNLSFNVKPYLLPGINTASRGGLSLTLTFR